jgi:hypothetical protein
MNKYTPWFFLIPVLLLLVWLPGQLRGHSPYPISTPCYILSIFGWLFFFCWIYALNRGSRRAWFFVALAGVVTIAKIGYELWIGPFSWPQFVLDILLLWIVIVFVLGSRPAKEDDDE